MRNSTSIEQTSLGPSFILNQESLYSLVALILFIRMKIIIDNGISSFKKVKTSERDGLELINFFNTKRAID